MDKVELEAAVRLRESSSRIGQTLIWHCQNTPLETWQAAIDAGGKLDRQGGLLHTLYNHRPKRAPTAQELAEIARGLEAMRGNVSLYWLQRIAADPEWAIFNLSQAVEQDDVI